MDLTQGSNKTKNTRAKKMMLWFGIASLIMSFGGLTSAFVASKTRVDWLSEHELPSAFTASLIIIILSSLFVHTSKISLRKNDKKKSLILFLCAVICAVVFVSLQFYGFSQLIELGYYFTGPTSNVTSSFIFLIAFFHLLHAAVGLICLTVVLIMLLRDKYQSDNMLGFELVANFWHFVDVLWIYLFLFLVFFI